MPVPRKVQATLVSALVAVGVVVGPAAASSASISWQTTYSYNFCSTGQANCTHLSRNYTLPDNHVRGVVSWKCATGHHSPGQDLYVWFEDLSGSGDKTVYVDPSYRNFKSGTSTPALSYGDTYRMHDSSNWCRASIKIQAFPR